jgi:hypothetical protein
VHVASRMSVSREIQKWHLPSSLHVSPIAVRLSFQSSHYNANTLPHLATDNVVNVPNELRRDAHPLIRSIVLLLLLRVVAVTRVRVQDKSTVTHVLEKHGHVVGRRVRAINIIRAAVVAAVVVAVAVRVDGKVPRVSGGGGEAEGKEEGLAKRLHLGGRRRGLLRLGAGRPGCER